jgi:putative N-acetyltransferase (TIGR04045 family)
MLDGNCPSGTRVRPFLSPHVTAEVASDRWQIAAYFELRARIFAEEQRLFDASDRDAFDSHATPIVALSRVAGMADEVIGVVRIYEKEPGIWFGGRLGVCERYRRRGAVGRALIECAVSTAHAWGCRRFFATVQERNVRYFEHYAFRALERIEVCGSPHSLMEADLDAYPPCALALQGGARRAA